MSWSVGRRCLVAVLDGLHAGQHRATHRLVAVRVHRHRRARSRARSATTSFISSCENVGRASPFGPQR